MPVDLQMPQLRIVASDDDTILNLDSLQGLWTEEQYLRATDHSRRLLEFTDGYIEVLPVPTDKHQVISQFLLLALLPFIRQLGGRVLYAPVRVQIREGKHREPDLLLVLNENDPRRQNAFWLGADLVIEIVSPDDPERDTRVKRLDYAEAGIPEYWIVTTLHRLKPSSFYGFAPMLYRPRATKVCTMSDAHNVLRQTRLRSANPLHHLLSKCGYNPQKKAVATGGYSPAPSLQL